jgi:hypothetical protein
MVLNRIKHYKRNTDMTTATEYPVVDTKTRKPKQYESEFEKNLMVDNLRAAVEIYGKDRLRKEFKSRKRQSTFMFHSSPTIKRKNLGHY